MESNIKLSFIIVSYNEKEYIEDCINSIFSMDLSFGYEIIIVDDGSNDGSLDLIKELSKDSIIKYFVMERPENLTKENIIPSLRVSNVIKKGIEISSGDYIMIISADDYYISKTFVKDAISYLDEHKEYIALAGDADKLNCKYDYFNYPNWLFWANHYIYITNWVVRNNNDFKKTLKLNLLDDTGYFYNILTLGKIVYKNGPVFEYRQRDDSITHKNDELETKLVEYLLYQDIIDNGDKLHFSGLKRYGYLFLDLYHDRLKIQDIKYKKYFDYLRNNKNNKLNKYFKSSPYYRVLYIIFLRIFVNIMNFITKIYEKYRK